MIDILNLPQLTIIAIFVVLIATFIWGRIRFDLVSAAALLAGVLTGVVKGADAFTGFSDDVVIIIAAALITSKAITKSGIVDRIVRRSMAWLSTPQRQVVALSGVVLVLSAFIKNVGALSMAMPAAYQFQRRTGTPASALLMPMAFASLLGGIVTLVGTSPNLIVSRVREEMVGQGFRMFDFSLVGIPVALVGFLYLALAFRLVPVRQQGMAFGAEQSYAVEVMVPEGAEKIGQPVQSLIDLADGHVRVLTLIRGRHSRVRNPATQLLRAGDRLMIEGATSDVEALVRDAGLSLPKGGTRLATMGEQAGEMQAVEAVVTGGSPMLGWTPAQLRLSERFAVEILGVKRHGSNVTAPLAKFRFAAGDVVVVRAGKDRLAEALDELGLLAISSSPVEIGAARNWTVPVAVLAVALVLMVMQIVPVAVAFFGAAVVIVALRVLPLHEAFEALDAPVLVTLACIIPLSEALRSTGVTDLLSQWLSAHATGLSPIWALALIMAVAMLITPFLNNAATVLVAAPIAAGFAKNLGYDPDPFLMAVALGAASDFLTPVGHQCNLLVYGAGGYRFMDYPRLGAPLSLLVLATGVPLIAWFWPP